jgi:AI-2 transport protein TqsA
MDTNGAVDVGSADLGDLVKSIATSAAGWLGQAVLAGVYLLFLLLGVGHLPAKIHASFDPDQAEHLLTTLSRINVAVASYLKAKVLASMLLAVPAFLIMWAFGLRSALLWGVLTFVFNFVPYVGSAITWTVPTVMAFLTLEPGWKPFTLAGLLLMDYLMEAYWIEPSLTGKAVDLNPLVVLLALAFWGSCWGLAGMLLSVPLTVVLRIVMENLRTTRPIAKLMEGG